MQTTEMLRKQHQKIHDIIKSISPLLSLDIISKDVFDISNLLATLSGKMKSHLTIEDSMLYPPLATNSDPDIRAKVQKFADARDDFRESFDEYIQKWRNSVFIQEKPEEFISETNSMFTYIATRINTEDKEIFTLFNKATEAKLTEKPSPEEENNNTIKDRRLHQRYQVQYLAYTFHNNEQLGVSVIDISERGAGVLLPRKFLPDEELKIRVRCGPSFDKINEIELKARVVWSDDKATDNMYRTGLKISDISNDDFDKLKKNIMELAGKQKMIAGLNISEKSILIIEDTQSLSFIMKFDLEKSGFKTFTATNGKSGIEIAKEDQPDLILLDVMLPGINGFETCKRLKADETTKGIPVIILSVKSQHEDILKGLEVGATSYIVKSAGFEKIYNKIIELIGSPK